ncbi:MAG TPA: protein kinase, partial [Mycobacteriales bacterium]|nr:protein kinase [Mycobacteriales bacterium]
MAGPDVVAGRFALCDPLARGAAGTVWRAWDLRRGDWCAAKVIRQRDAGDLLRFAREQSLRLHHPHLLTPYSWAAEDAHVAIVSPLVAGGSLHTLLGDHGPLAPELVADLLDQLLDGLAYAHEAGIVHRDVTPANVLLEATGTARPVLRLADFGLAVRIGEPRLTRLGTVLGTPGYVPPEVLAGAAPAPAADLYAAGRLAIALLTGADPDGPPGPGRIPGTGALHDIVA